MPISLSRATETISGTSDRTHPFTFEWQDKEDVKVYLNGSALTQDDGSDATKFSITGSSGSANVVLGASVSIAADDILVIQRETPKTYAGGPINFTAGPLKAATLNEAYKHQLYLNQEAERDALDLGDKMLFKSAKSLALNIDASEGTGGGFTSASAIETDPGHADATEVFFQSPSSYAVAASTGVQFKEVGKYLVTLKVFVVPSTATTGFTLGFGTQETEGYYLISTSSPFEMTERFYIDVTAPGSLRPYAAAGTGSASIRYLEILVERVT